MRWYLLPTIQLVDNVITVGWLCMWIDIHIRSKRGDVRRNEP